MKNKYFIILAGVISIALFALYWYFGGFEKIKVQEVKEGKFYKINLWGKEYHGNMNDTTWKKMFMEIRDDIIHGKLSDPITIVYFRKPELHEKKIRIDAFIGAGKLNGLPAPGDLEEKTITRQGALRVRLTMHPIVMPGPEKVRQEINAYATRNHITLDTLLIEKYFHDNSLDVEIPIE